MTKQKQASSIRILNTGPGFQKVPAGAGWRFSSPVSSECK